MLTFTLTAGLLALGGMAAARVASPDTTTTADSTTAQPTTVVVTKIVPERYHDVSARVWARRYRAAKRHVRSTRRVLMRRPSVVEAIDLACATYGYCSTLWRKARCETGGTFSPHAYNPSGASGLFQFLGSTWRSTPYGRFSIWSPYANALAAGWMHEHGRGGEWSCR